MFFKLGGVYGSAWTRQYEDEKALACATTEWSEALAHFDFATIKRAFEYARANVERPPTLPQFVGLCRQFRRTGAHQLALPAPAPLVDTRALAREHLAAIRARLAA